jgi:hypothetical protein
MCEPELAHAPRSRPELVHAVNYWT